MTDQPPLVPAEIDLSKIDGFMLDTVRLLGSELVAISTGEEFKAAVLLWARSWHQRPAASLPDDDRVLASFAMVPLARWKKVKPIALRGFVKCSDGRLYHKVLAEDAVRAWGRVTQRREAIRKRYGKEPPVDTADPTAVDDPNNGDGYETSTVDGTVTGRGRDVDVDGTVPLLLPPSKPQGERASAQTLPPDWKLPDDWRAEAEKARADSGLPSANLDLAAASFRAYAEGKARTNWHGDWLRWALKEHASKGANGHAAGPEPGEPDPAKEAARIAGMIATMVQSGKRLFPMAVSDRQLVAACRANTLPRELLEQWLGPGTTAEILR